VRMRVQSAVVHGDTHSRAMIYIFESSGSLDRLCLTHTGTKHRSGESSSFSMVFDFDFSRTLNLKTQIGDYNTFAPGSFAPSRDSYAAKSQDATLP